MLMKLEKMSFVETDWYVTQDGGAQAKDFIFKDFCDYIIIVKTFAKKDDNSQLMRTDVIHIDSNDGRVNHRNIPFDLDPPLLKALADNNFPFVSSETPPNSASMNKSENHINL